MQNGLYPIELPFVAMRWVQEIVHEIGAHISTSWQIRLNNCARRLLSNDAACAKLLVFVSFSRFVTYHKLFSSVARQLAFITVIQWRAGHR